MREPSYSPEQVTKTLMRLAANRGDVEKTADEIIDDEFMVPADTLRYWKLEEYGEQYKRLEREIGQELETQAIAQLRSTVQRTGELQADLLEEVGAIRQPALMPNALRALSDAKAKGTNELLQLTGRPTNGGSSGSLGELAAALVNAGLLVPAAGLQLEAPTPVPNEADGEAEAA